MGSEQAPQVCVQVRTLGRLSTGGNTDRRRTSSTNTCRSRLSIGRNAGRCCASSPKHVCWYMSGAVSRQEATPVILCLLTQVYVQVRANGQLSTAGGNVGRRRVCMQVQRSGRLSTGGNASRRCASSPVHVCSYASRSACGRELTPANVCQVSWVFVQESVKGRLSTGGSVGRQSTSSTSMGAGTQPRLVVNRMQCW